MDEGSHDRLSELFERAVEMPPEARAQFLEVCSDDPAVRAELWSLLAAYDRSPNLLERLAGEVLPAALEAVEEGEIAMRATPEPAMPLFTGQTLAHYRLLDRIGRGGMGQVFRAEDTRLQRYVAIKVLPGNTGADTSRRLLREARAAAALSHPSIITI